MPFLLVSSLAGLEKAIEEHRPSHLVTLLSPDYMIDTPPQIAIDRHLRLALSDVGETWESDTPPSARHVDQLIAFGRNWGAKSPMLLHCWAGVSRSMAAAYTVLCDRAGPGQELAVAQDLRARAAHAYPNSLLVRLADAALDRKGRMIEAAASIGRGQVAAEGGCVVLPVALPAP